MLRTSAEHAITSVRRTTNSVLAQQGGSKPRPRRGGADDDVGRLQRLFRVRRPKPDRIERVGDGSRTRYVARSSGRTAASAEMWPVACELRSPRPKADWQLLENAGDRNRRGDLSGFTGDAGRLSAARVITRVVLDHTVSLRRNGAGPSVRADPLSDAERHRHQARSNRSRFMTLFHAATKSRTNFSFASSHA